MPGTDLMPSDADKIFTALGVLKADMSNLSDRFDDLNTRVTDEQRKVHDIVVATSEAQRVVVRQIDNLQRLVDEMKPLTDDYREKRAEARGAARLAGWLYTGAAAAGGTIVLVFKWVLDQLASRAHILIILALASLFVIAAVARSRAQDDHRHPVADIPLHEKFYNGWFMPDQPNKSCCSGRDCYPTTIRYIDGVLHARRREDGRWLRIPIAKIERHRDNPDGRNHLCAPPPNASYPPDTVFCFALGAGI